MKTAVRAVGRWLTVVTATLAVLATALPAAATPAGARLFGTLGYNRAPSTLVEIDPMTGDLLRTIGPVGYTVNGLAYDQTSGILYASTAINDPTYNGLIVIDMNSGAGMPVGVSGWGLVPPGSGIAITNVAADSRGGLFAWSESGDDLVSIDKATGIASWVGDSGVSSSEYGLAFNAVDTLYLVNGEGEYGTVDTATGWATYVDDIGTTAHHGDFDPVTGLYYGIDRTGYVGSTRELVVADLATGTVVSVFPTVNDLHTLEFVDVTPKPDLIVSALSHASPALVTRYLNAGQVYVRCQQANQGNLGSRSCLLRFWLSSDMVLDSGDRPLVGASVRSLAPGQKTTIANTLLRLGRRLAPGETVYIIAEVDSDGVVVEQDETNNTAVLKIVGP